MSRLRSVGNKWIEKEKSGTEHNEIIVTIIGQIWRNKKIGFNLGIMTNYQ